jgi:hypothetical protein
MRPIAAERGARGGEQPLVCLFAEWVAGTSCFAENV